MTGTNIRIAIGSALLLLGTIFAVQAQAMLTADPLEFEAGAAAMFPPANVVVAAEADAVGGIAG